MAEDQKSAFNKASYDMDYYKRSIVRKVMNFNKVVPDDMELLNWLESQSEGISPYIKRLIREDMRKK